MQAGMQRHSYSSTIAAELQPHMGHFTCMILRQCAAMGPLNNGFYVRPSWVLQLTECEAAVEKIAHRAPVVLPQLGSEPAQQAKASHFVTWLTGPILGKVMAPVVMTCLKSRLEVDLDCLSVPVFFKTTSRPKQQS